MAKQQIPNPTEKKKKKGNTDTDINLLPDAFIPESG